MTSIFTLRTFALVALSASGALLGCSAASSEDSFQQSNDELSAAEYFGTAGEAVKLSSLKITPGTLTIANANTYASGGMKNCSKTVRIGTCLVHQNCVIPSGPQTPPQVQPVTLTSGPTTISITPQSPVFFDFKPNPLPGLIAPGASVHAVAGGVTGSVPAFTLDTTMPAAAVITSPDYSKRVSVHRTAPFVAEWTGGNKFVDVRLISTEMAVVVGPNNQPGGKQVGASSSVECLFPASAGRGAIPMAALAHLPLGQGAPESFVFESPVGTHYTNINLQISSESHALQLSIDKKGPAIGELIVSSANDNTSDVDIVQ